MLLLKPTLITDRLTNRYLTVQFVEALAVTCNF